MVGGGQDIVATSVCICLIHKALLWVVCSTMTFALVLRMNHGTITIRYVRAFWYLHVTSN